MLGVRDLQGKGSSKCLNAQSVPLMEYVVPLASFFSFCFYQELTMHTP